MESGRRGDVVGWSSTSATNNYDSRQAFFYTDERGMINLGTFGGTSAGAADINDDGWICGGSIFPPLGNTAWIYHEQSGLTILGPGIAKRINEQRAVICDNEDLDPVLTQDGRVTPIRGNAELAPLPFSGDLNDWNVIVGSGKQPFSGAYGGYVWTAREGMRDLNKLIATNSGWIIDSAFDINNQGQITGIGYFVGRGQAFRLDPIPPRPGLVLNGTNVTVSWSPVWPGLVLEASSELSSTNWTAVPTAATNVIRQSLTRSNRFSRLNLDGIRGLCCVPE